MSFYRTDATPKWVWLQKRRTERTPNNSHFPLAHIQPIKFKFWWHLKVSQRASSSAEKLIPGENKLLLIVLHLPTNCSPTVEEVWRENCEKKKKKKTFKVQGAQEWRRSAVLPRKWQDVSTRWQHWCWRCDLIEARRKFCTTISSAKSAAKRKLWLK